MSEEARAARLTLVRDEAAAARKRRYDAVEDPRDAVARAFPLLGVPKHRTARRLQYLFEGRGWTWANVSTDLAAATVAVSLATANGPRPGALLAFPLVVIAMLHLRGIYGRRVQLPFLDAAGPLLGAISVAAMSVLAWQSVVIGDTTAASATLRAWGLTVALLGSSRLIMGLLRNRARARGLVGKTTLIVGAGIVGSHVARRLQEHPEYGLRPVGFLDDDPPDGVIASRRTLPVVAAPRDLATVAAVTRAEHVILAFSGTADRDLVHLTRECEELGLEVSLVPRLFESINDRMAVERLGGLPLFGLRAIDPKGWQFRLKYALERPFAAFVLLVMAPVLVATAIAIKLTSPGPVIFRQRRIGRDGKAFDFLKFRSMRTDDDEAAFKPTDGYAPGGIEGIDRRTPIGRFLRRSAIDELPQFLNVVKGEMSIVGPRPERPEYVEMFGRDHDRYSDRHRVKSGITGWAQVHGLRGQTSLSDRVEWDNFYIENWSLWLDLKILLMTIAAVVRSGDEA